MRLWLADRTEEAFTCTLTLGEHVLQREAWVEDCLYGSSTTCAFEHNHGAYSGSTGEMPRMVLTGEGLGRMHVRCCTQASRLRG